MNDHDDSSKADDERRLVDALAEGFGQVLRYVRFSTWTEWLAELRLSADRLAVPYVRLTCSMKWDPSITILQHITAVAGFWTALEYVELGEYCGQRMQREESAAVDRYEAIRGEVTSACKNLGVEVRGGIWQPRA